MLFRSAWAAAIAASILQLPSFHSEARLVVLHVSVRNSRGEVVTNLPRDAFSVYENGKQQPVRVFRRDDMPVSVGLLIDNSGSMRSIRATVESAALTFARESNPEDELFVMNFADKPELDVPFTSDPAVLARGIARVDAIGGTAMRDAIQDAERYMREHATRDRRALVIVTDGNDNESTVSLDSITQAAQQRDVVIYAIGLFAHAETAKAAHTALDHLTERSGGFAYYPQTADRVGEVAQDVAHQIRNQYALGYSPLNQALDGSYRSIQVKVSGRERLYPRTRAGYLAVP
ncbi:MAG TPA: VWA domain-containing protein [Vicinamibacterales bacterium]